MLDPQNLLLIALACLLFGWALLSAIATYIAKHNPPLAKSLRTTRNLVLPLGALYYFFGLILRLPQDTTSMKLLASAFWVCAVWAMVSLVKGLLLTRMAEDLAEERVPRLFIDLVRFVVGVIGILLVLATVWHQDLSKYIATLGIGSLVLGLALQDTLGNLFAGIALFFERPFKVGHWVRIGGTVGKVIEMNWRAVRLYTRQRDLLIVPNSVLGKEQIENYSIPSAVHATVVKLGFSYNDPPNKVKRVLLHTALTTPSILSEPNPVIRTVGYSDFAINYDIKFFISDFERLPDIEEGFFTRVWYAARRNGLTIPFPIRSVYKTEVPPLPPAKDVTKETESALKQISLLKALSEEELLEISKDAIVQEYASGEPIISQGSANDALFIVHSGRVKVVLTTPDGEMQEIATLSKGDFFGEMSVLTGEVGTAAVVPIEDVIVIALYRETIQALLGRRPEIAEKMAEIVEVRRQGLARAGELHNLPPAQQQAVREGASHLLQRIRRFFA
jgi:small-conductance mechanosensitive channel/CRP-like cAMP-binding protein